MREIKLRNLFLLCMVFLTARTLLQPNYLPSVFYNFLSFIFYFIKSVKVAVNNFAANENMQASFHKEQLFFSNGY